MTVTVTTVYALDMPKYVYVQLFGQQGATTPPPLRIRADKIEKGGGGVMVLKLGNETVGELNAAPAAWWIQDEEK